MNKKYMALSLAVALTIGAVAGGALLSNHVARADKADTASVQSTAAVIGLEEAVRIAQQAVSGRVESAELERSRSHAPYYEVEIEAEDGEYEVKVDAATGEVLRIKRDDDWRSRSSAKSDAQSSAQRGEAGNTTESETAQPPANGKTQQAGTQPTNTPKADSTGAEAGKGSQSQSAAPTVPSKSTAAQARTNLISADQAGQIAVKLLGGRVVEVERDRDDGVLLYEVELRLSDGREAEVDVDATTGKVLAFEIDDDDDDHDD